MYYQKRNKMNKLQTLQSQLNDIINGLTKGLADTRTYESWSEPFNKSVSKVLNSKRKSKVFKYAWTLVKGFGMSLSDALKKSWATI